MAWVHRRPPRPRQSRKLLTPSLLSSAAGNETAIAELVAVTVTEPAATPAVSYTVAVGAAVTVTVTEPAATPAVSHTVSVGAAVTVTVTEPAATPAAGATVAVGAAVTVTVTEPAATPAAGASVAVGAAVTVTVTEPAATPAAGAAVALGTPDEVTISHPAATAVIGSGNETATAELVAVTVTELAATPKAGAKVALPGLHVLLDGTGDYISTPDAAALDITGDIDLRVHLSMDDWTPAASSNFISKWTGTNLSYLFRISTAGELQLFWSTDGTAGVSVTSSTSVPFSNGTAGHVRATFDVNTGSSSEMKFYTSTDGVNWTQLGVTRTSGSTESIYAGTADISVGANTSGTAAFVAGKIYSAQVYNGIAGTLVADFNASRDGTFGESSTTSSTTGEVWTYQGDAALAWDPAANANTVSVLAATPAVSHATTPAAVTVTVTEPAVAAVTAGATVSLSANTITVTIPAATAVIVVATRILDVLGWARRFGTMDTRRTRAVMKSSRRHELAEVRRGG